MKKNKKIKFVNIPIGLLLLLIVSNHTPLWSQVSKSKKYRNVEMTVGNIPVPHERTLNWKNSSAFAQTMYKSVASKKITEKMLVTKEGASRILLARLLLKQNVAETNQTIQNLTVWGNCGSSWALNPNGDYDFPLTILTTILWKFGEQPNILYPETKNYLLNVLLSEDGGKFSYTAPKTLGLHVETENHMLMTGGSRYLKNRWISQHGNSDTYYDNVQNGLEEKLLSLMGEIKQNGLYEFNSIPYLGFTVTALLNLEAFASEKVRIEARNVLDYINFSYALSSYKLKHYPPMRRRYDKAGIQELTVDYNTAFMKSWLSYLEGPIFEQNMGIGKEHAVMGACMPYRPADKVVELLFDKKDGYFVRQGHGQKGSPEISSAGKNFLISSGGVNRGTKSEIVARPICLFLNDNTNHLSQVIHIEGPGANFMKWNNTGVYKNFACTAGPVFIPKGMAPIAKQENWSVYSVSNNVTVVVYSTKKIGLISVFENVEPLAVFKQVLKENPNTQLLSTTFKFPNGSKLSYDVSAKKDKWVLISQDDKVFDRDFDSWPLIDGNL